MHTALLNHPELLRVYMHIAIYDYIIPIYINVAMKLFGES